MTVETHLHRARERVERERDTLASKREALDAFADRVRERSPSAGTEQVGRAVAGGVSTIGNTSDEREQIRSAFAETVGQHTDSDAVVTALQSELGEEAALALAPTTNTTFTPQLQQQLLSQTTARERELTVTMRALDREAESIQSHLDTVDTVVTWLVEADETPLSDLGFESLRSRHERLDEFQTAIAEATRTRQSALSATTSQGGHVGVSHRSLVDSLYDDFPVDFPVLSTATRLLETCEDAQQAVRAHLSRRG